MYRTTRIPISIKYNDPNFQILPTIYEDKPYDDSDDIRNIRYYDNIYNTYNIIKYPFSHANDTKQKQTKLSYKKIIPYFDIYKIHKSKKNKFI